MKQRIKRTVEKAQDAFWEVVVEEFKEEAKSGDVDPFISHMFDLACSDIIEDWIENNCT